MMQAVGEGGLWFGKFDYAELELEWNNFQVNCLVLLEKVLMNII